MKHIDKGKENGLRPNSLRGLASPGIGEPREDDEHGEMVGRDREPMRVPKFPRGKMKRSDRADESIFGPNPFADLFEAFASPDTGDGEGEKSSRKKDYSIFSRGGIKPNPEREFVKGVLGGKIDENPQRAEAVKQVYRRMTESGLSDKKEEIIRILKNAAEFGGSQHQSDSLLEVAKCDLWVLLGLEPPTNPLDQLAERREEVMEALTRYIPHREGEAWLILECMFRPALSLKASSVPVLHGPPSGGKSYLLQAMEAALGDCGIKAQLIVANATETDHTSNQELVMSLLGIDAHWGNGSPGKIYRRICDGADFVMVLLDEIDKRRSYSIFLDLFDVGVPLQDQFTVTFAPNMNMRCRVVMAATANDVRAWEHDDAFANRIFTIPFDYTLEEKRAVIERITKERGFEDEVIDFLQTLLETYPKASIREVMAVGSMLQQASNDNKELVRKMIWQNFSTKYRTESERRIGFLPPSSNN